MDKPSRITANLAAAAVVASLFGLSAFADSRHRDETNLTDGAEQRESRGYESAGYDARRGYGHDEGDDHDNGHGNGHAYGHWRNGHGNGHAYGRYGRGDDPHHSITMEGRVTRMMHERDGYRVYLDHGDYSYWIPEARFNLWPFHVGLAIRLGGWWDPMGYVNVYDMGPIGGPYYTSGDLSGLVESVDYRRGTAVVRDDLSGSFVTVLLRGNDPRLGDLRPGDYVDISGAWSRNGLFEAYNLLAADGRHSGYGY